MSEDLGGPAKKKEPPEKRSGRALARPASQSRPPNASFSITHRDQYGGTNIEAHQGVFPSPRTMYEYKQIDPRINESLMEAFLEEGRERRWRARILTEAAIDQTRRGQHYGLITALFFGGVSAVCAITDHGAVAGIIATVDLVSLVSVFVIGKVAQRPRDPANDDPAEDE